MSGPTRFCLSAAAILRCTSLSRFQHTLSIIPVVLEVIFSSSLPVILWKSGSRRHLLVTAEAWIYFILAILNLLTHSLESARTSLQIFSSFDIAIGVLSFLPLFVYTFFLYVYCNAELLHNTPNLPRLLGKIGSVVLLFAIPGIIGANEIASFLGVERIVRNSEIMIGFRSGSLFSVNTFFSSLTLALLVAFQAVVFFVTFFRFIVAILNQRKFEYTGQDARHSLNGIAWLSAGMKLGAIESTIGFAGGGFNLVIARRTLRFLSRACLCIGIIKGVDQIEDFTAIRSEMDQEKRRTEFSKGDARGLRNIISNPRTSTFQQLSPTARGFNGLPRAHLFPQATFDYNNPSKSTLGLSLGPEAPATAANSRNRMQSLEGLGGLKAFGNLRDEVIRTRTERVTVGRRGSNGAPTLHLRLSSSHFPSPSRLVESIRSSFQGRARSSSSFHRMIDSPELDNSQQRGLEAEPNASSFSNTEGRQDPVAFLRPNISVLTSSGATEKQFVPPSPHFRDSVAPSVVDSVAEIVMAPQRNISISQRTAQGRLYSVGNVLNQYIARPERVKMVISESPGPTKAPPTYHDSDHTNEKDNRATRVVSDSSLANMSVASTLATVRELTRQFPGPPVTFNGQPLMAGLGQNIYYDSSAPNTPTAAKSQNKRRRELVQSAGSTWSIETSVQDKFRPVYSPPTARTRGSPGRHIIDKLVWKATPSRLSVIRGHNGNSAETENSIVDLEAGRGLGGRFDSGSEYDSPAAADAIIPNAIQAADSSVPAPDADGGANLSNAASRLPSGGVYDTNATTTDGVVRPPSLVSSNKNSPYPLIKIVPRDRPASRSAPVTPDNGSAHSQYILPSSITGSVGRSAGRGSGGLGGVDSDPFSEIAVRTGGSSDLRKGGGVHDRDRGSSLAGAVLGNWPTSGDRGRGDGLASGLPTPPSEEYSPRRPLSKLSSLAYQSDMVIVSEPTPRRIALSGDEARRRQQSIDAAAHLLSNSIPWVSHPEIEEEERELVEAIRGARLNLAGGAKSTSISRIKTVGTVKQLTTPSPVTHPTARLGSTHVRPIMIPRQSMFASQMEIIRDSPVSEIGDDGSKTTVSKPPSTSTPL